MASKRKWDRMEKMSQNPNVQHEPEGKNLSGENVDDSVYEQCRDQRIKENLERMKNLGILELSRKIKPQKVLCSKLLNKNHVKVPPFEGSEPPRRSSRLITLTPVCYKDLREKTKKEKRERKIFIPNGSNPEIYTEEHDKLLGECKTKWTLYVDGYNKVGKRIYDPVEGETCHQCRQKTLGLHTHCSICDLVQGQLCGDCLYMRYGENVIEANQDSRWICLVCRGICNCSLCRKAKGWAPTGNLYRKVISLGFKSVAHYLIQTRRSQPHLDDPNSDNSIVDVSIIEEVEQEKEDELEREHEEGVYISRTKNRCSQPHSKVPNSAYSVVDLSILEEDEQEKEEEEKVHILQTKHVISGPQTNDDDNDAELKKRER